MQLNIDYPPENVSEPQTDVDNLRAWCVLLYEELNNVFNQISGGVVVDETEKLVNWK